MLFILIEYGISFHPEIPSLQSRLNSNVGKIGLTFRLQYGGSSSLKHYLA